MATEPNMPANTPGNHPPTKEDRRMSEDDRFDNLPAQSPRLPQDRPPKPGPSQTKK